MVRRMFGAIGATVVVLSLSAGLAFAGNPATTGQPSASCGSDGATTMPHGFTTGGFAMAESQYAGSEGTKSLLHSNSDKAVSQYDVACYQITQHH
jgi:hypothetical protein